MGQRGFTDKMGIYKVNHEGIASDFAAGTREFTLQDYSEKVVSDIAVNVCPDDKGGLYYLEYDYVNNSDDRGYYIRYIGHWDGTSSDRVYDFGEYNSSDYLLLDDLYYDGGTKTLFVVSYNKITALTEDETGQLKIDQEFGMVKDLAVVRVDYPASTDEEKTEDEGSGKESDGNSGEKNNDKTNTENETDTDTNTDKKDDNGSGDSGGGGCSTASSASALIVLASLLLHRKSR